MHRRICVLVFALFLVTYAYFYNAGGGNQAARMNQTRALAAQGTLYNDGPGFPSDDHLFVGDHVYSNKAPGTSLLGVAPFVLFYGPIAFLGLIAPVWQNLGIHLTFIATVGVPSALMGMLLFRLLVRLQVSPPRALLGALATGLGTICFPYATMYFGHTLAGALAFAGFYLLREALERRRQGLETGRRVFFSALFVGYAVLVEYPAAILAAALTGYLLISRPARADLGQWTAGGAIAVAGLALYNALAFGHPLSLSYLNYARSAQNNFPETARGFAGVTAPRLEVLAEILWGSARGLLWFSPVVVLVVPGFLVLIARRRDLWREGALVAAVLVGFLLFNAGYGDSIRYWGGANAAGPRHLIPMLPFTGLVVGLAIQAAPLICLPLIVLSIVICLAVTAVMPQVPMLYSSPMVQFILPYFLEGRLAVHRGGIISRRLVTADSIAYNWGKLAGLPGHWSLLPLLLIDGALLIAILNEMRRSQTLTRRAFKASALVLVLAIVTLMSGPVWYQQAHARPSTGPGVRGTYFAGEQCKGTPVWIARESGLSLLYQHHDVRPFPDTFCGRWQGELTVVTPGAYRFQLVGNAGKLRIDGVPVPFHRVNRRTLEGSILLTAGTHRLELEAVIGILHNRLQLLWAPPGHPFGVIPVDRLQVTDQNLPP